ncbi:MAG: hypothetical protein M3Y56_12400, partial [Armatimonadota bacterium]|nr:hypothetical protein [Armatimonadota bacterium]
SSGMGANGMSSGSGSSMGSDLYSDDTATDTMSGTGAPMTLTNDTRLMMMGLINSNLGEASSLRAELGELRGNPALRSAWRRMIRDHIRSARMISSMSPGLVPTAYIALPDAYPALGSPRQIVFQTLGAHRAVLMNLQMMEHNAAEPQLGLLRRLETVTTRHVNMLSGLRTMAGWHNFNNSYMMRMNHQHMWNGMNGMNSMGMNREMYGMGMNGVGMNGGLYGMGMHGMYGNGIYRSDMYGVDPTEANVSAVGVPTTDMSGVGMNDRGMSGRMNGGGMSGGMSGGMNGGMSGATNGAMSSGSH